ncbi:hypothetical protein [Treponema endosymbiont of Eucomonympha sp.]|uniref:hypothetical protein n=1 Tax=Treponema endosymbiont of Eucomonympha sp. TaxID=1580831 RepID=UPI001396956B|nr:hypothetical protein [Treponema endosymbiont of Eucomonympha sp.]
MTEIELKARIADYESTRRALSAFVVYEGRYDKRDTYWRIQRGEASDGKQALFDTPPPRMPADRLRSAEYGRFRRNNGSDI